MNTFLTKIFPASSARRNTALYCYQEANWRAGSVLRLAVTIVLMLLFLLFTILPAGRPCESEKRACGARQVISCLKQSCCVIRNGGKS